MKNGLLIWNVLLTIALTVLFVFYFKAKKGSASSAKHAVSDTTGSKQDFSIAYFEMDSVAENFQLVKEVKADLNKREAAISNEMERMGKEFQQKYNYYQKQAQAGSMDQAKSEAASEEMKALDEKMRSRKQELDKDYNEYTAKKQNEIKTRIEAYMKEYNKAHNFTYIISYEPGLFYYKDTAYNITNDVVKGLNDFYKAEKKQ
jgi:outer membrane protein